MLINQVGLKNEQLNYNSDTTDKRKMKREMIKRSRTKEEFDDLYRSSKGEGIMNYSQISVTEDQIYGVIKQNQKYKVKN